MMLRGYLQLLHGLNGVRNWCIGLSYCLELQEISKDFHLYS